MMEATRKRARLEEKAAAGPLVSLQTIFSLANETRRCFVEGEAIYNASHIVFCGIREATDDMVSIEALCLQSSGVTSQPHCVKVHVGTAGTIKVCTLPPMLVKLFAHFLRMLIKRKQSASGTRNRAPRFVVAACATVSSAKDAGCLQEEMKCPLCRLQVIVKIPKLNIKRSRLYYSASSH